MRPDPETQMVSMEDVKAIMDNHRRIVTEVGSALLQAERDEADRRAGAAWRLLSRYKKRVRQLRGEDY